LTRKYVIIRAILRVHSANRMNLAHLQTLETLLQDVMRG